MIVKPRLCLSSFPFVVTGMLDGCWSAGGEQDIGSREASVGCEKLLKQFLLSAVTRTPR
jgi:hypothetical protein